MSDRRVVGNKKERNRSKETRTYQLVRIVLELLLKHDPEPGTLVFLLELLQVLQERVGHVSPLLTNKL